jgi:hypothetical protein
MANRIIIKEVHALSAAAQKTSAFYMRLSHTDCWWTESNHAASLADQKTFLAQKELSGI